jgi:hypothetical protein
MRTGARGTSAAPVPGRAVQLDPIKPTLIAPGTKRFKLRYYKLLSSFASNFKLRRYMVGRAERAPGDSEVRAGEPVPVGPQHVRGRRRGRAVQVDPVKPIFKASGIWN